MSNSDSQNISVRDYGGLVKVGFFTVSSYDSYSQKIGSFTVSSYDSVIYAGETYSNELVGPSQPADDSPGDQPTSATVETESRPVTAPLTHEDVGTLGRGKLSRARAWLNDLPPDSSPLRRLGEKF